LCFLEIVNKIKATLTSTKLANLVQLQVKYISTKLLKMHIKNPIHYVHILMPLKYHIRVALGLFQALAKLSAVSE
jgi:hypothetical protein